MIHTEKVYFVLTFDALARTDLVLPLSRHDLSVDTRDVDASVQTSLVVGFDNVTAVHLAGTDTAVVRTLGTGETALGPSVRPAIRAHKRVLLLETKPKVLLLVDLHQARSLVAVVELVGGAVRVPGFAEHEDVVAAAEGVGEHGARAEVDVGVVAGGLAGGGAVKVPLWELVDGFYDLVDGLRKVSLDHRSVCLSR